MAIDAFIKRENGQAGEFMAKQRQVYYKAARQAASTAVQVAQAAEVSESSRQEGAAPERDDSRQTPFVEFKPDQDVAVRETVVDRGIFATREYSLIVRTAGGDKKYAELPSHSEATITYPDLLVHPEVYNPIADDHEVVSAFEVVSMAMQSLVRAKQTAVAS